MTLVQNANVLQCNTQHVPREPYNPALLGIPECSILWRLSQEFVQTAVSFGPDSAVIATECTNWNLAYSELKFHTTQPP